MAESTTDWVALSDTLNSYHVPEIFLAITGIVALLIVYSYLKDKESGTYKMMVLLGVIVGVAMVALCVTSSLGTALGTTLIVAVACFALIIRPFRDVHFSLIIALMAMVLVYVYLGGMTGDLAVLASGWQRVVAAFVVGAVIYLLLGFLEAIVMLFGKILNAWPVLAVLGIVCIVEAICVYCGYGSVYDMILGLINHNNGTEAIIALL